MLLKKIGLEFEVVPSGIEEKLNPRLKPRGQAEELSKEKAMAVAKKIKEGIIIAADTLISINDEILMKPVDLREARKMLAKLGGKKHMVYTGFTIIDKISKKEVTKSVETGVWIKNLNNNEINNYFERENPMKFAGSYRIQGLGSLLVERIEGDYFNVVGLPIYALTRELRKFGIEIL